jgi:hypothetical protein
MAAGKSPKGHTALDHSCPLQKAYKTLNFQMGDSSDKEATTVHHAVSVFETVQPVPSPALTSHAPEKADRVGPTSVEHGGVASCRDDSVLLSRAESLVVALTQPAHINDDNIHMTPTPSSVHPPNPFQAIFDAFTAATGVKQDHPTFQSQYLQWIAAHAADFNV